MRKNILKSIHTDMCELEGPYECPYCHGHMMLDATYLDQISGTVTCPYCKRGVKAQD